MDPDHGMPGTGMDTRLAVAHERAREGLANADSALERMRLALEAGRANLQKALQHLREIQRRDDERMG